MKKLHTINQFTFTIPEGSKCTQWRKYGFNKRVRTVIIDRKDGSHTIVLLMKLYAPHVIIQEALLISEASIPEIIKELQNADDYFKSLKQQKG